MLNRTDLINAILSKRIFAWGLPELQEAYFECMTDILAEVGDDVLISIARNEKVDYYVNE